MSRRASTNPPGSMVTVVLLAIAVGVLGGCRTQGKLDDYTRYDNVRNDLEPEVAQMVIQEYATAASRLVSGRIETIEEVQSDAAVARKVSRFGEAFLASIRHAAWRLHPLAAALDSTVLLTQVASFLDGPQAETELGPALPALKELVRDVDATLDDALDRIVEDRGKLEDVSVATWALENPITDIDLNRRSPLTDLADDAPRLGDAFDAVTNLEFDISTIYGRVNEAISMLPIDLRRQIVAATRAVLREPIVVNALVGFSRLGEGMKETGEALSRMNRTVDELGEHVLEDVERQRSETIEAISAEREKILSGIEEIVKVEAGVAVESADRIASGIADRLVEGIFRIVMVALFGFAVVAIVVALIVRPPRGA